MGSAITQNLRRRNKLRRTLGAREHRVVNIDLTGFGGSALTDANIAVPEHASSGIPITYVPARNTIMLSLALAWAEVLHAQDIFFGVNAVDYSGYPDCRPEYVAAFERMANLATQAAVEGKPLTLHAPLLHLTKAEIIQQGSAAGGGLRAYCVLLSGRRAGQGLRSLRFVPLAPGRISIGRSARFHALSR